MKQPLQRLNRALLRFRRRHRAGFGCAVRCRNAARPGACACGRRMIRGWKKKNSWRNSINTTDRHFSRYTTRSLRILIFAGRGAMPICPSITSPSHPGHGHAAAVEVLSLSRRLVAIGRQQGRSALGKDRTGVPRLLHPHGVCLAGTWRITQETPYSGLFATGKKCLIIARYSSEQRLRSKPRTLSLVGKLFPTHDRDEKVYTASFITQSALGG